MAKKKKVTEGAARSFFNFGGSDDKNSTQVNILAVLKAFAIAVVLVLIGLCFVFLERYTNAAPNVQHTITTLKIDKPAWVSEELMDRIKSVIKASAAKSGDEFIIDDRLAETVSANLAKEAWLYNIRVQILGDTLTVSAQWRKPVAVFQAEQQERYITADRVVLEYVPLKGLSLIDIKGLGAKKFPDVGQVWDRDDIAAAIELIQVLEKMDQRMCREKPLLSQLIAVDVGNYNCRQSASMPQLVLYAKDGTNINWGAPVGQAQRNIEAPETEKLAMLYDFYRTNGKLEGPDIKYIELRIPQKNVPSPVSTQ